MANTRLPAALDLPEFSDWFGCSAVSVRRGGRPTPQVVYHLTNAEFSEWDEGKRELGFHFGSLSQLEGIAKFKDFTEGLNVRPVYLAIHNPIRLKDEGSFHADGIAVSLAKKGLLSMKSAKEIVKEIDANFRARKHRDEEMRVLLQANGFDGVVYSNRHEGAGNSWIAFNASQIKSAFEVDALRKSLQIQRVESAYSFLDSKTPKLKLR